MAENHLTDEQIKSYTKLSGEDLFLIDGHLSSCADCQNRLSNSMNTIHKVLKLKADLSGCVSDHLLFEQLKAYVEKTTDEVDREIMETHFLLCEQCAEDVSDLAQTRRDLQAPTQSRRSSFIRQVLVLWKSPEYSGAFRTMAFVAFAGFVTLAAGVLWHEQKVEFRTQLLQQKLREAEKLNELRKMEGPESKPLRVCLLDGGRRIGLDQQGDVYGASAYPEEYRSKIREVLNRGNISAPAWLGELGNPDGIVRGENNTGGHPFGVLDPVGRVVESAQPQFRWNQFKSAAKYQVTIYDDRFRLVMTSPLLASLTWSPFKPLKRGVIYTWQVNAISPDGNVTAPQAPAPEAKFKILEEQKKLNLDRARREIPDSHLLLAVLYAEYGLMEEASAELEQLKKKNPDSVFAGSLSIK